MSSPFVQQTFTPRSTMKQRTNEFFNSIWQVLSVPASFAKEALTDSACPVASALAWIGVLMAIYYMWFMPTDRIQQAGTEIKVKSIRNNTILLLSFIWVVVGFVSYAVLKRACDKSIGMQLTWAVGCLLIAWLITTLILMLYQDSWTFKNASEFVLYLNKPQSK